MAGALKSIYRRLTNQCRAGYFVPKCILIVDDSTDVRKAIRQVFESRDGFEVCGEASNGQDAIEKARILNPDLVVLDFSMPIMNGLEAAKTLRKMMPGVPLIMLTAHKSKIIEAEASAAGIGAVLSKDEGIDSLLHHAQVLLLTV